MRKMIKLYIFTLVICFIGMMSVNAQDPTLTIEGNPNVNYGVTSDFAVRINTHGVEVASVIFRVDIDNSQIFNIPSITSPLNGPGAGPEFIIRQPINDGIIANIFLSLREAPNVPLSSKITINARINTADGSIINLPLAVHPLNITQVTTTTVPINQDNAELDGITLSGTAMLFPAFNERRREYVVSVGSTVNFLTITPSCDGCTSRIELNGVPQSGNRIELEHGFNLVTILTTSLNGRNTEEYTLNVFRGESAFLQELRVVGFDLSTPFNRNQIDYRVYVPYETTEIEVLAIPDFEGAEINIIGYNNLEVGENVVTITVTIDELDSVYGVRIYNITVIRLEAGEEVPEEPEVEEDETGLKWGLIAIISLVGLSIIGVSWYFLFGKGMIAKKKAKKKAAAEEKLELDTDTDVFDKVETEHTVETALEDLMNTKEILATDEIDGAAINRKRAELEEDE